MESLLSPSESHAFQSFLSSIDYNDPASLPEWGVYATHHQYRDDDILVDNVPEAQGTEALAKATKDLISLDSDRWNSSSSAMSTSRSHSQHAFDQQQYDSQGNYQQQHHQQPHQHQIPHQHHRNSYSSSSRDSFPFLHSKAQQLRQQTTQLWPATQQQQDQHTHHVPLPHQLSIPSLSLPAHLMTPTASSSSSGGTPISPHTMFPYPPNHHHHPVSPLSTSPTSSTPNLQRTASSSRGSTSSVTSTATTANPKRPRTSPPYARSANPVGNGNGNGVPKQMLLSPSQKKANHIQSEQKRRANIRRGYEALCETVPALREAIREEEEAEAEARANGEVNGKGKAAATKGKRGKKGKGAGEDEKAEKDKIDGRAGPRSENVVLSKTIDYMQDLIAERTALLARLHRARSSLPPGHPALVPISPDPAWEREWKGGDGRLGDEEVEDDEDGGASGDEDGSS